jgi:twin BRCT domain
MTVTNFQGEARAYLEKLIEACGAKFTRNMTIANTHLIAARSSSSNVIDK